MLIENLLATAWTTLFDVLPIAAILAFFQLAVLRRRPPRLKHILTGFAYVLAGLSIFLVGLQEALFPLGENMARQLTDPGFLDIDPADRIDWAA